MSQNKLAVEVMDGTGAWIDVSTQLNVGCVHYSCRLALQAAVCSLPCREFLHGFCVQ